MVIREALANEKEQDFKGVLTKVKAKNPDVIMFGGMDAQAGPMLKQMKALGIKAKFISGDGAQSAELIKLGGDAAEGSTPRPLVCRREDAAGRRLLRQVQGQVQR